MFVTRNINQSVNNGCPDVFNHPDADFGFSPPDVRAQKIDNILRMICDRIH
jgi:hypothetical protein